jgi:hypothetical protein
LAAGIALAVETLAAAPAHTEVAALPGVAAHTEVAAHLEVEGPGEAALPARAAHAGLPVWVVVECEAAVAADEAAEGEDKRRKRNNVEEGK